jgi:outer membrane protein
MDPKPLILAALVICILAATACTPTDRYTYSEIRQAYAGEFCRPAPAVTGAAPGRECPPGAALTLDGAMKIALANNPDLQMAAARIAQAEAMAAAADAAFFPTLGLWTETMTGDAPSSYLFKSIDQRKLPSGVNFNDPGWFENNEAGARLGFNLYNGGKDRLNRQMAQTGITSSRLDRHRIENALRASVIRTFFNVLAAVDFIDIARESVRSVAEQHRIMTVRFQGGGALKSDVLSLAVRLAEAREELVRSESRLNTARTALARIMGVEIDPKIGARAPEALTLVVPADLDAGLNRALADRPEIAQARQRVIASRMAVDLAAGGYRPRVDLQSRYWFDDPNLGFNADRDNWTAALVMNWTLFSGHSTRAGVNKARHRLREMLAADNKALLDIRADVRHAYHRWKEARTRLEVARTSVQSAQESFDLVRRQYEGGSATITRYLDAELARNRSRLHAAAAFYDTEKSLANVGRAVGLWAKGPVGDASIEKRADGPQKGD